MNDEVAMFLKKTQNNKVLNRPKMRSPAVNSDASFGGQQYDTNEIQDQQDFEDQELQ